MDRIGMAETRLSEEEIAAALRVLRSGQLRQGPECAAFEASFAEAVGARHAVACANGTAALHLAYLARFEPGDEVLVPAFTFVATASMLRAAGLRPVFCDVDPDTCLLDLTDAERRMTPRCRGLVPVHLYGNPCALEPYRNFAATHGLHLVWDAAQAQGASWRGQDVGGYPGLSTYSFYPTKNLFVGEGGMVTTDDPALAERLRLLRSHGESGRYNHVAIGFNYRMSDVEGAIGRRQLSRLPAMLATRRRNAAILDAAVATLSGLRRQSCSGEGEDSDAEGAAEHAFHQYCVFVDQERLGLDRDRLASRLEAEGIASAIHYPVPLHKQPVFADEPQPDLPQAERLAREVLALPVHHGLSETEVRRIADALAAACAG